MSDSRAPWERQLSNLDRLPPLVVCDRWRWQALWFAVALALPVACGVVVVVALAMYERGGA
jgi:hypothetical protein